MSTVTRLLTADEFAQLPNEHGRVRELVRGEVVEYVQPTLRHRQICARVGRIVGNFADEHRLGHVVSNNAGIRTEYGPDTVRCGDVWFVSYEKVPSGPLPFDYLDEVPDIVFEVLSPSDRRSLVHRKVGEYLEIGIRVVCVLDPLRQTATIYRDDGDVILENEDDLTFPDQLPGFFVPVSAFFE